MKAQFSFLITEFIRKYVVVYKSAKLSSCMRNAYAKKKLEIVPYNTTLQSQSLQVMHEPMSNENASINQANYFQNVLKTTNGLGW